MRAGCVFCAILDGDPRRRIEQARQHTVTIVLTDPLVDGHRLVVPRVHVTDAAQFPEVTAVTFGDAARVAQDVGDCNLITSVGEAAAQTIPHLHVHVIPRHRGDGLHLPWTDPPACNMVGCPSHGPDGE